MYSPSYYGLNDEPTTTVPPTDTTATTTVAQPVPPRDWRPYPRRYSPRRFSGMQPQQQPQQAQPGGLQFYDHQMALAAQQNAQMQQVAQTAAPEPSGIGGISWPVIALAGGGFLMLMMVMMSGKK